MWIEDRGYGEGGLQVTLIEIAQRGDYREFTEQLRAMTAKTHGRSDRKPMTEDEKLLDEAYWYAQHGEFDEAIYRLSQAESDFDPDSDDDDDFDDEDYE
jgi:hypothetical protein